MKKRTPFFIKLKTKKVGFNKLFQIFPKILNMQVQDWVIDIYCDFDNFVLNPKCHSSLIVPESHLLATIKFIDTFFELLLKNGFAVLHHPLMKERHFVQTMSIIEIIYEFFGDIIIASDNDCIHVPVLQKPFCHITNHKIFTEKFCRKPRESLRR